MATKKVWTDGVNYCVADTGGEALRIYASATGEDPDAYDEAAWSTLPDDHVINGSETDDDEASFEPKTCDEWAKGEKRYLFSTDW